MPIVVTADWPALLKVTGRRWMAFYLYSENRKRLLVNTIGVLSRMVSIKGKRPELTGGGLLRSAGGWGVLKSMRRMKEHLKGDERILGDSDFVMQVLESAQERMEERYRLTVSGYTFERVIEQVSEHFGISIDDILFPGKHPHRVKARSVAAYLAVKRLGMDGTTVGRRMGVGQSTISRAVTRGEKIIRELNISFTYEKNN